MKYLKIPLKKKNSLKNECLVQISNVRPVGELGLQNQLKDDLFELVMKYFVVMVDYRVYILLKYINCKLRVIDY